MRKIQSGQSKTIGFQNGQDASLITLKRQARAQTVPIPIPVQTQFSKIGGTVANITEATQQTSSPTAQNCSSGYQGVSYGLTNADTTANRIGKAQNCAVCSDAPSSEPYSIVLPCKPFIDPFSYNPNPKDRDPLSDNTTWKNVPTHPTPGNAPGETVCCANDPSQLTRMDTIVETERVKIQALHATIRTQYNLPPKLEGLRGPVFNAFRH